MRNSFESEIRASKDKLVGQELKDEGETSRSEILDMNPKELADFLTDLYRKGELESFLEEQADDPVMVAQFSYWEKWFTEEERKLIDMVVSKKKEVYGEPNDSLPLELDKRFTEEELKLIFKNMGAIQLTFGCSKGCPFCGVDAVPGKREHISYFQLANLFQQYGELISESKPMLYWASEPSDYASREALEDRTYQDVHQLAERYAGYSPHITSKEADNQEWLTFLGEKGNSRISIYSLNYEKINELKKRTKKEQIEMVGEGEAHRRGLGVSSLEYDSEAISILGIGCFNGILMTPRGLYNVVLTERSKEFPQAQMIIPIESLSGEKIKLGDSVKEVLRKKIVRNVGRNKRLILEQDGDYYFSFSRDGNITEYEKRVEEKDLLEAVVKREGMGLSDLVHKIAERGEIIFKDFGSGLTEEIENVILEKIKEFDLDSDLGVWEDKPEWKKSGFSNNKDFPSIPQESTWYWHLDDFYLNDKIGTVRILVELIYQGGINNGQIGSPKLKIEYYGLNKNNPKQKDKA